MPRIVIGVPVYNGISLIQDCLENLSSQYLDDFEVIISDNASTDGTSEMCAAFADKNPRFRHTRHTATSSAYDNFRWVRDATDSEFFAFRAYDDISSPHYFGKLGAILAANPDARLAVGNIRQDFGPKIGERMALWHNDPSIEAGPASRRIPTRLFSSYAAWFYGLWRREALAEAFERVLSQYEDLWAGDHLMLLHAMLADGVKGTSDPEVEFTQRLLPGPSYYGSSRRPEWAEMTERNARFLACARDLLAEADMDPETRRAVGKVLVRYTYKRCYPWRRVAKARLKRVFGKGP